jgi:hypothetical protein
MSYWAATRLEPHREKVSQYFLEQAGYEVYLPKIRQRRYRKGRRIEVLRRCFRAICSRGSSCNGVASVCAPA